MHISYLELSNFRSYSRVSIELPDKVSVFLGPNGQGKTNLMEAVIYLSSLGSHRVAHDEPLVKTGASQAVIRGKISYPAQERETLIEVEIVPGKSNRARLNRSPVSRAREILGYVNAVLFAPEDLALVKGDPSGRRKFMDDLLVAKAPRFSSVKSDYDRILKQRNALLKTAGSALRTRGKSGVDLGTLDVWDSHLAEVGSELLSARLNLVESIGPLITQAYTNVAGVRNNTHAFIEYKSSLGPQLELSTPKDKLNRLLHEEMSQQRKNEIERGISLVGPHRDDIVLRLGDMPAKGYASHGESWSYALALRLASYELLRRDGDDPILILDDVFAELDNDRRDRLAELAVAAEQVLVTAAVPEDVPDVLSGARFIVSDNDIQPVASRDV